MSSIIDVCNVFQDPGAGQEAGGWVWLPGQLDGQTWLHLTWHGQNGGPPQQEVMMSSVAIYLLVLQQELVKRLRQPSSMILKELLMPLRPTFCKTRRQQIMSLVSSRPHTPPRHTPHPAPPHKTLWCHSCIHYQTAKEQPPLYMERKFTGLLKTFSYTCCFTDSGVPLLHLRFLAGIVDPIFPSI